MMGTKDARQVAGGLADNGQAEGGNQNAY